MFSRNCRWKNTQTRFFLYFSCCNGGYAVFTDTPLVKVRENVVEALLLNHPLDCLFAIKEVNVITDQTKIWGSDYSCFFFNKRGVEDKNCGPLIKTIMTRCIHCTRCVRFCTEIAGVDYMGTMNRGTSTEFGSYVSKMFDSISGNVLDLCPVGALTSKPCVFKARLWEFRSNESVDLTDSTGSSTYVNFKETEIVRILSKNNNEINESIISDKPRFSYDAIKTPKRLQKLFESSDSKNFKNSSWISIFGKLDSLLKKESKVTFVVNSELDFESLQLLSLIENKYNFP